MCNFVRNLSRSAAAMQVADKLLPVTAPLDNN